MSGSLNTGKTYNFSHMESHVVGAYDTCSSHQKSRLSWEILSILSQTHSLKSNVAIFPT